MTKMRKPLIRFARIGVIAFITLAVTIVIATFELKPTTQIVGEQYSIGDGVIRPFVTLDTKNHLTAIGVTFTETVLAGLPSIPVEYELALPPQASASAYRYVVLNWNPQGHGPIGIYDVPHFDFHFYSLSGKERQNITATGDDLAKVSKAPPPEFIPTGYVLEPTPPAPREGRHWMDSNSPEFHGQAFTKTFIYGSYDGEIVFVEPMFTKVFLETKPNMTESIGLPVAYPQTAYYPARYSVKYNRAQQSYTVSLDALTWHQGSKS